MSRQSEPTISPQRLLLAREWRGVPQSTLAADIDVTERTLHNYERTGAPLTMLPALARALDVQQSFLSLPAPTLEADPDQVFFRARRKTPARLQRSAAALGVVGTEVYDWIGDRFTLPSFHDPEIDFENPVQAAAALRALWGLGTAPLPNLVHIAEARGIRVMTLPLESQDVDAFSFWAGSIPFVFLSRNKSPERSRFDLAHEIGHIVMHSRSEEDPGTDHDRESEAQRFASSFLMDPVALSASLREEAAVPEILNAKRSFGVSAMALARALHDAGRTSDWIYRQNCVRLSQLGYRSTESDSIPRESSRVFSQVFAHLGPQGARELSGDRGLLLNELRGMTFDIPLAVLSGERTDKGPTSHPALKVISGMAAS